MEIPKVKVEDRGSMEEYETLDDIPFVFFLDWGACFDTFNVDTNDLWRSLAAGLAFGEKSQSYHWNDSLP